MLAAILGYGTLVVWRRSYSSNPCAGCDVVQMREPARGETDSTSSLAVDERAVEGLGALPRTGRGLYLGGAARHLFQPHAMTRRPRDIIVTRRS